MKPASVFKRAAALTLIFSAAVFSKTVPLLQIETTDAPQSAPVYRHYTYYPNGMLDSVYFQLTGAGSVVDTAHLPTRLDTTNLMGYSARKHYYSESNDTQLVKLTIYDIFCTMPIVKEYFFYDEKGRMVLDSMRYWGTNPRELPRQVRHISYSGDSTIDSSFYYDYQGQKSDSSCSVSFSDSEGNTLWSTSHSVGTNYSSRSEYTYKTINGKKAADSVITTETGGGVVSRTGFSYDDQGNLTGQHDLVYGVGRNVNVYFKYINGDYTVPVTAGRLSGSSSASVVNTSSGLLLNLQNIDRSAVLTGGIYSVSGRKILNVSSEISAGTGSFPLPGGTLLAPGVYLFKAKAGDQSITARFTVHTGK